MTPNATRRTDMKNPSEKAYSIMMFYYLDVQVLLSASVPTDLRRLHPIRSGMRKPDTVSFERIIEEKGLNPARTLFVDDSLPNIEGARSAGLQGVHIKPGTTILDIGL